MLSRKGDHDATYTFKGSFWVLENGLGRDMPRGRENSCTPYNVEVTLLCMFSASQNPQIHGLVDLGG